MYATKQFIGSLLTSSSPLILYQRRQTKHECLVDEGIAFSPERRGSLLALFIFFTLLLAVSPTTSAQTCKNPCGGVKDEPCYNCPSCADPVVPANSCLILSDCSGPTQCQINCVKTNQLQCGCELVDNYGTNGSCPGNSCSASIISIKPRIHDSAVTGLLQNLSRFRATASDSPTAPLRHASQLASAKVIVLPRSAAQSKASSISSPTEHNSTNSLVTGSKPSATVNKKRGSL